MRKLLYQSIANPALKVDTADEAEKLFKVDPENPDFKEWQHILVIEADTNNG